MLKGGYVVGDLDDIVARHARGFSDFEQQEFGKRGLCALNLRREQCLLSNLGVEKIADVGKKTGGPIKSADSQDRLGG